MPPASLNTPGPWKCPLIIHFLWGFFCNCSFVLSVASVAALQSQRTRFVLFWLGDDDHEGKVLTFSFNSNVPTSTFSEKRRKCLTVQKLGCRGEKTDSIVKKTALTLQNMGVAGLPPPRWVSLLGVLKG